ncbi:MAG TPA: hypothetical protein VKI65_19670 [Gemmataceae bacterium]|nr:hypothetical protein [Gemmataceae bacterium]
MNQFLRSLVSFTVALATVLLAPTQGQSVSPELEKEAEQKFLTLKKQFPGVLTKFVRDSKSFDIDFAVAALAPVAVGVNIEAEGELKLMRRTGPTKAKLRLPYAQRKKT